MLRYMLSWVRARLPISERGQDLVEYAIFTGLIALTLMAVGFLFLQGAMADMATGIGNCVDFVKSSPCDPF